MTKYSMCSECGDKIPLGNFMCDDCHSWIRGYTHITYHGSGERANE